MQRIKPMHEPTQYDYDVESEPITLSKMTLDKILKESRPMDLIALYSFYYYTAKWQGTSCPKATIAYAAKGLKCGVDKIRAAKQRLIRLGLIEDVQSRNKISQIDGHFIKVKLISWNQKSHPIENTQGGKATLLKSHTVANSQGNAYIANKKIKNIQKEDLFTPLLESFPTDWQKNHTFHKTLRDFQNYRKEKKKSLLTNTITAKRFVASLVEFPVEEAIERMDRSMVNGWTGVVFPNEVPRSNGNHSNNHHPAKDPIALLDSHFKKASPSWIKSCYTPAVNVIGDPDSKPAIASNLCQLADWLKDNQERPKFDRTPKYGDRDYYSYNSWGVIPVPITIVEKYLAWLEDEDWIKDVSPNNLKPDNKLFKKFLAQYQNDVGYNFLSGASL